MAGKDQWIKPSGSKGRGRRGGPRIFVRRVAVGALVLVVVLAALSVIQLLRAVPNPTFEPAASATSIPGPRPSIAWPAHGEAATEVLGVGSLGRSGGSTPTQIASVAKMMTALLVIHQHPLSLGQGGPTLTMTPQDYQIYLQDKNAQDSVMAIAPGERLDEFQLLEALLIPSADNIATVLANWDAGSVPAFVAKMNAYAASLGLSHTHYGDPSGLTPSTTSIPSNQLQLAGLVLQNPVLAQIVSQAQATLPVAGTVYNVDYALGHDNIVGIKTGSILTGNFVMATQIPVGSNPASASRGEAVGVSAILDQGGVQPLITALDAGKSMARSLQAVVRRVSVLRKGETVGQLSVPGGGTVPVLAGSSVNLLGWGGLSESLTPVLAKQLYGLKAGAKVGTMTVSVGQQVKVIPLYAGGAIVHPSVMWRLTNP